jgi:hypothetical protein
VLHYWYSARVSSINNRDLEVYPSLHPTIPPCLPTRPSTPPKPANDSRAQLEPWLEEFETHARKLCAQHDATGALTLVASDQVWNSIPANQTAPVRIAAGDPPHRARPTWDQPQPHANNAAAAVVSLYKMKATRLADFSMASSTLNTALLAIGQCWGEKPEPSEDDLP